MNAQKAQEAITKIIANYRDGSGKAARNQYPASKAQIAELTELGIIDMMPLAPYAKTIGHTEAKLVLAAAREAQSAVMVDYEGQDIGASELYLALNEADVDLTEAEEIAADPANPIRVELPVPGVVIITITSGNTEYTINCAESTIDKRDGANWLRSSFARDIDIHLRLWNIRQEIRAPWQCVPSPDDAPVELLHEMSDKVAAWLSNEGEFSPALLTEIREIAASWELALRGKDSHLWMLSKKIVSADVVDFLLARLRDLLASRLTKV